MQHGINTNFMRAYLFTFSSFITEEKQWRSVSYSYFEPNMNVDLKSDSHHRENPTSSFLSLMSLRYS